MRSREPLFWATLAFAAGVLAGATAWRPPLWWVLAAAVVAAAGLWFLGRRLRVTTVLTLVALACLGALAVQLHDLARRAPDLTSWTAGQEVTVTAHVVRDSLARPPRFGRERQVVDIETEELSAGGAAVPLRTGLRLTVYSPPCSACTPEPLDESDEPEVSEPSFLYGERLRFTTRLRLPRNYGNPGALDFRNYLLQQGIGATATVRADRIERLRGRGGSRLGRWRAVVRRSLLARLEQLWGPRDAALLAAMLAGQRTFIDRQTRLDFQRTGTYHILVVSGMNVGILTLVVFWLLRRLRAGEAASTLVTVLVTGGYAWLTDVGAPIQRATLMLWLYLGARLFYRGRAPLNAVGAAALVILLVHPRALFEASFQLTFLSVLAIGGVGLPLLERTSAPYRRALRYLDSTTYDFSLPPRMAQFRLDVRLVAERVGRFLGHRLGRWALVSGMLLGIAVFDLLVIAALMQVALAVPMAAYFHRAAIFALPANAAVVPLTTVLMPSAVAATVLSYLSVELAHLPAWLASVSLHAITGIVRFLGGLSAADLRVPAPALPAAVASLAALAFAMAAIRRSRRWVAGGLLALTCTGVWIATLPPPPRVAAGVLEVTSLDVGQGDSHLLVTPQGRAILLDGGGTLGGAASSFDVGEEVVSPYLWARGFARLDAVALSHAHTDHISGLTAVITNFRPRELWLATLPDSPRLHTLLQAAREHGVTVRRLAAGDSFEFGGVRVEVLFPPRDWLLAARQRNDDSMVLRLVYGQTSVLLGGDSEKKAERLLAPGAPQADLLKVAHHGAATSTTPELLASVRPRFAVVSAGYRNPYRYPAPVVLERLQAAGVSTYRTDIHGAVTFYLDGKTARPAGPGRE